MRVHLICKTHRTTALVGPGSLLDEYECPTCIEESDRERWVPCCSAMNTTCCGHDDPDPWGVTLQSPNFCDARHAYDEPPF